MTSLVYVSSAVQPFSKEDLLGLLARCQDFNARVAVTGMLLYKDGNFMQVIEGEVDAVEAVFARILKDPRHRGIITLLNESIEAREYPEWSMEFRDLTIGDPAAPGGSEVLSTPLTPDEFMSGPGLSRRLLRSFKQSM